MSKKNGRRLFSKKDGTSLIQDLNAIQDELQLFFNSLPTKLRNWMYEATFLVDAIQNLDEALRDGQPADQAIDFILNGIKGEADEAIYEAVKVALHALAERVAEIQEEINDWLGATGVEKRIIVSEALMALSGLNELESDTVTQNAVYIYKS